MHLGATSVVTALTGGALWEIGLAMDRGLVSMFVVALGGGAWVIGVLGCVAAAGMWVRNRIVGRP